MLESAIMDYLTRRKCKLFCDDCLTRELQGYQRARIRTATLAIGTVTGFQRTTETCASCGGMEDGAKAHQPTSEA
jgi:hypothetical protein